MTVVQLDSLPTDVLLSLADHVSLTAKVSLALCNKTLFKALNGPRQLQYLRYDGVALRYFLGLLEQDLPIDYVYCSLDCKFHRFSIDADNANTEKTSTRDTNPPRRMVHFKFHGKERCQDEQWKGKISRYVANTDFWNLRAALKLQERCHPLTQTFLQSLNYVANVGAHPGELLRCEWRAGPAAEPYKPLVLLRLQHWYLIEGIDLMHRYIPRVYALNSMVCSHGHGVYLPNGQNTWDRRIAGAFNTLTEMQRATAMAQPAPASSGLGKIFGRKAASAAAPPLPPDFTSLNTGIFSLDPSSASLDHQYTHMHQCLECRAQYRIDMIQVPCSPKLSFTSRSRFSRGRESDMWAFVVTRWSCIGNAVARYDPNLWNYIMPSVVETGNRSPSHRAMELFEGKDCLALEREGKEGYRPDWTAEMEENVVEWNDQNLVGVKERDKAARKRGKEIFKELRKQNQF